MSKFLDRFRYFKQKGETFSDGHGQLLNTNRDWEDGYRHQEKDQRRRNHQYPISEG